MGRAQHAPCLLLEFVGSSAHSTRCKALAKSRERSPSMYITRNANPTTPGPAEWFTGTVFIDLVAAPTAPSRLGAAMVHFTPGARTAWHTHPLGQTIYVTEGVGRC